MRRPRSHALRRDPHRHAVLAQQRHHVRLHGRRRHGRVPARPGQADRQLRRPGQPVRSRPHRGADRQPFAWRRWPSTAFWPRPGARSAAAVPTGGEGTLTEFDMVQWLSEAMRREGLVWENGPNVSANANSSDSHYEPTAEKLLRAHPRRRLHPHRHLGPLDKPGSIFYDITWTGVVGREPTEREQLVFETVRNARDAAIAKVEQAFAAGQPICGYEADDAARAVIRRPASANSSPTAPATTSPTRFTAPARTSTTSKPTTSAASCPTPASPSSRESICPSSACAARSTCSPPRQSLGHGPNSARAGENLKIREGNRD
jgi:hypothetical protein